MIQLPGRTRSQRPRSSDRGYPEIFSALVRPHLPALYRLAYRLTRRTQEAEDLVQELLTRLYAGSRRLEEIQSLRPWLARSLYNLYVDECRRSRRNPLGWLRLASSQPEDDALEALPDRSPDLALRTEMACLGEQLDLLVQQLPDEQREVVILHDVEGYELQETAEIVGVALGTVKSRLHRGHSRLREALRERNVLLSSVVISDEGSGVDSQPSLALAPNDEM